MIRRVFPLVLFLALSGCARKGETAATTAAPAAPVLLTYEQQQGKDLYTHYCAICHGDQGGGDGFNSYNLDPKPHSLADSAYMSAFSDRNLEEIVDRGGRGVNMSPEMPAYGGTLSRLDIAYLTAYVRSLSADVSHSTDTTNTSRPY